MPDADEKKARIAAHFSATQAGSRTRWWQSRRITSHINRRICGQALPGTAAGDIALLQSITAGRPCRRGISVGCGLAWHEIQLLRAGVVDAFELYEYSPVRRQSALESAKRAGVVDRLVFPEREPFEIAGEGEFDLVYWKDALHHMPDTRSAVQWSSRMLRQGGIFFMNEFTGKTDLQHTPRQLDLAERARASLAPKYLVDPKGNGTQLLPHRRRPVDIATLKATDPSECQDSDNILPSVRDVFPGAGIIPTGGIVYMLAMSDVLANLDEEEDASLIDALMLADDLCVELGESLYSVAWAVKE